MKHAVRHDLDPPTARKAAEGAWESYQQRFSKYDPRANWVTPDRCDIQFSVKGIKLTGTLELVPGAIELDLVVPFLLRPFKSQAIGVIEREIQRWIEKARSGEI